MVLFCWFFSSCAFLILCNTGCESNSDVNMIGVRIRICGCNGVTGDKMRIWCDLRYFVMCVCELDNGISSVTLSECDLLLYFVVFLMMVPRNVVSAGNNSIKWKMKSNELEDRLVYLMVMINLLRFLWIGVVNVFVIYGRSCIW